MTTSRCDNAGENKAIEKRSQEHVWQLGITFEFTSAGTPQHNALVEKFFETVYIRTRATMSFANIPMSIKHIVCKMLVIHLTNLFNLEIVANDGEEKARFEWWGIPLPNFTHHLHPWGVAGVVFTKTTATRKLEERGLRMMYVGASLAHSVDTFRMFDAETKRIHLTRDVKMLKKMFYREDHSVSSDISHPLDITFENLMIVQDAPGIEEEFRAEMRVNTAANTFNMENKSNAFSSASHESIDSHADMPPLERRAPDLSSYSDDSSSFEDWSNSTATTLDATLPEGVRLNPVTVREVDPPLDVDVVDATNLQPGDTVDLNPPIPTLIEVSTHALSSLHEHTVTRTHGGRRIQPPSRYRDSGLTTFDRPHSYSIVDIEDELMSSDDGEEVEPLSIFAHSRRRYFKNETCVAFQLMQPLFRGATI